MGDAPADVDDMLSQTQAFVAEILTAAILIVEEGDVGTLFDIAERAPDPVGLAVVLACQWADAVADRLPQT